MGRPPPDSGETSASSVEPLSRAVITLTTDFGLADHYVASLKGVILSTNPQALILDVTHDVRPQRIEQAAFLLGVTLPYLPSGAVHVVVVDPGVGTERRALAISRPPDFFVGPDNGALSPALPDGARPSADAGFQAHEVPLPAGFRAFEIRERAYMREPVSNTFHGRDIFSPAAAHLSLGVPLERLGPPVERMLALPPFRAPRRPDGVLAGRVVHVDRYGNLITDVRGEDLPSGGITVEIMDRAIAGPARTFAEGPAPKAHPPPAEELMALVGSTGYLGIACRGGSAAALLGADLGEAVVVRPA